ncbi:MAG: SAM-dependent methyltransferase [Rhodospirillales bacterium]|nr:SAM-dependent methyltransferase [Rhodospirillales bacterium]
MERLDAFMARANAAYYATHDPFADFTTAPEISQIFGELLGAWAVVAWQAMGTPGRVFLVEAGPGRGTLMADALRLIARVAPGFAATIELHLIETSPRLIDLLSRTLPHAILHATFDEVPAGPMILLANEFLDALPIRQFVRRGRVWRERYVESGAWHEGGEVELDLPGEEGAVRERGEAAEAFVARVAARIAAEGGIGLFLDYGPAESAEGDSLQALRAARPAPPLEAAGEADLTAHVDFAAMAAAARRAGAAVHGPVPQGMFLTRLGLQRRAGVLARHVSPARAAAILRAARRLAEPDGMGRLFKVLAVAHPRLPVPEGFA